MAIAGGATNAYTYKLVGGEAVIIVSGARQWSECDTVEQAVAKLRAGESATVAAGAAPALRATLTGKTVGGGTRNDNHAARLARSKKPPTP